MEIMVYLTFVCREEGQKRVAACLDNGSALQKFAHMLKFQVICVNVTHISHTRPNVIKISNSYESHDMKSS